MRAVIVRNFGAVESAAIGEFPKPVPGPHDILLKVDATAANFVDTLVIGGTYQFLPELPFVPGKLPAGTVAEVGTAVKTLKAGDRVLAMAEHGGYGEFVAVPETQCFKLPAKMSFVYQRHRGGVGLASVQLAKAMGAKVLAGISSPDKADSVRQAGADATIDLSRPDLRDSLRAQVHAATGNRGADIILDPVGGDVFDAALRALAWRGRLVVIGFASGRIPTIKANYLLVKNIEVTGLQISDYRKRMPGQLAACFAEIFALYETGKIKPAPTTVMPIEKFATALADIRDRRARGRIVLSQGRD